jgi:ribosomal protein L12E/L44/L45/RPP1/RPP2
MPLAPGTLAAQAAAHPDPKQDPPFDPTGDEETEDTENNEEEEKEDGEKHK